MASASTTTGVETTASPVLAKAVVPDRDHDGTVSRLEALDKNADGHVTHKEFASLDADQNGVVSHKERIDINQDGRVSSNEQARIDANRDGTVSRQEYAAARNPHATRGAPQSVPGTCFLILCRTHATAGCSRLPSVISITTVKLPSRRRWRVHGTRRPHRTPGLTRRGCLPVPHGSTGCGTRSKSAWTRSCWSRSPWCASTRPSFGSCAERGGEAGAYAALAEPAGPAMERWRKRPRARRQGWSARPRARRLGWSARRALTSRHRSQD